MSLSLLRRANHTHKEQHQQPQQHQQQQQPARPQQARQLSNVAQPAGPSFSGSSEVSRTALESSSIPSKNKELSTSVSRSGLNKSSSTKSLMYAFKSLGCGTDRRFPHDSAAELASEESKITPQTLYYPGSPALSPGSTATAASEYSSNHSLIAGAERTSLLTEDTLGSGTLTTPISLAKSECSGINASYAAALDCELDCMADCDQLSFEIFGKYVFSHGGLDSSTLTSSDVAGGTPSPTRGPSCSVSSLGSFGSVSSAKSSALSTSVCGTGTLLPSSSSPSSISASLSAGASISDAGAAFEQRCVPFLDDVSVVCCMGEVLGKGTFGSVRKAQWLRGAFAGQCFALKVMPRHSDNVGLDRKRRRQFVSEVRCLTALSYKHSGIVGYMTCMMDRDNYYLCTRLASMNLWDLIFQSKNQCLSMDITVSIVRSVLHTLCFMHDHHWAHSDIKPDNVVLLETYPMVAMSSVTEVGSSTAASASSEDVSTAAVQRGLPPTVTVQLVDFGMAAYVEDERLLYKERGGTLEYLSPERLNQRVSGFDLKKSDVWSVGVLALELLMGRWLFDSKAEGKSAVKQCIRSGDWTSHTRDSVKRALGAHGRHFLDLAFNPSSKRRPSAKEILSHAWLKQ